MTLSFVPKCSSDSAYIHVHTVHTVHTYMHIYAYIYVCVQVAFDNIQMLICA